MSTFNTALSDVFEGREEKFSQQLRDLLHQLYDRGANDVKAPHVNNVKAPGPDPDGGLQAPVRVGHAIPTISHLRAGHRFQNSYLKQQGQCREVVTCHRSPDGRVTHLTTHLMHDNGTISMRGESFDQQKLLRYKPYRRIS